MSSRARAGGRRARGLAGGTVALRGPVMPALPRAIPGTEPFEVGLHVISEREQGPNADDLVGIMEVSGQNGHVRGLGDLPEPGLPALDRLAGALRRQSKPEFVIRAQ